MLIKQNQLVINGTTLDQSDLQAIANVASDVQAQIDTKAPINNAQFTGNVGIGTNPSATLDVVSNSASGYVAEFRESNASNFGTIVIDSPSDGSSRPSYMDYATGGTVKWSTGLAYNDTTRAFHIGTGSGLSNSKVTIDTNGNVGIGTSSPDRKLDVRGAVRFSVNTTTHETFVFTTQAANDAKLIMKNASSQDDIILRANGDSYFNGGNVGIGTASPGVKLEVNGGADGSVVFGGRSDGGNGNNRRFNLIAYADGGGANYGGGLKIQTRSSTNVFADAITVQSNGITIPQRVQPAYYEPQIKYQAVTGGFSGGSASANTWYPITNQSINGYNSSYSDGARGVNFLIKWTSGNVNRGYHHTVSGHIPALSANSYLGYQNGSYGTATSGTSPSAGLNINISHHTGCASGHNIQCRLFGDGTDYGSIYLQIKAEAPPSSNDCQISFWKV